MKVRIVCDSKLSIHYNVFFLNKNTEISKLHEICSHTNFVYFSAPLTFDLCSTTFLALETELTVFQVAFWIFALIKWISVSQTLLIALLFFYLKSLICKQVKSIDKHNYWLVY